MEYQVFHPTLMEFAMALSSCLDWCKTSCKTSSSQSAWEKHVSVKGLLTVSQGQGILSSKQVYIWPAVNWDTCTNISHHLLKSKPVISATWYILILVTILPKLTFVSRGIMNWKHLCVITSLLGNSWEQLCFVKRISSSSFEWQLCLSRNLALEKLAAPHFPFLPSFLAFRTHPKHPEDSWSVWKSCQHRVGPPAYFCSFSSLVLSAILQMKQGIVSAGCSDCNHCEGVVCFAPLVLPQQVWMEPREVSAAPYLLLQLEWL